MAQQAIYVTSGGALVMFGDTDVSQDDKYSAGIHTIETTVAATFKFNGLYDYTWNGSIYVQGSLKPPKSPIYIAMEEQYDNGDSGAAFNLTLCNGQNQKVKLTSNSVAMTVVTTGCSPGKTTTITLEVEQDTTGGRAISSASVSGGTVYKFGTVAFPAAGGSVSKMAVEFDGTNVTIHDSGSTARSAYT